jgi:hypothetical protein
MNAIVVVEPRSLAGLAARLPSVFLHDAKARDRFFGFFTTNVRTGITDYLKSDGSVAEARKMANHADTRATQLYDRRGDSASLGEYEKVGI